MKKNQFSGIDLLVINKFKAPIEKFNTEDDLQDWCEGKVNTITQKDYKGRQRETHQEEQPADPYQPQERQAVHYAVSQI